MELDFSNVCVLHTEEVVIGPSLIRPDYVFKVGDVIFMMEFESSHVGTKKKKLFKLYIASYDYKNNDDNNKIVFLVLSTKESSKMANYSVNDWDSFNFPIISLKELDKGKIINNIETKLKDNIQFNDRELLELALTPILEKDRDSIVRQFFETADLLSKIRFPSDEIKCSVYGVVLMLSSMYFDDLDPIRKRIQGDLMGKVDCVMEACEESYDEGMSDGMSKGKEDVAKSMLRDNFADDVVSRHTGLPLERIAKLKAEI